MLHIQHPTLFVLCIYFSLHLDTDRTLRNIISHRRSGSPLMFFQLPVCSCEPNYHSSQKIAALWKKEEGVLFSFCDSKVLLSGSSSCMKNLVCICFCYLDLFFFHGLFCHILVSLSYDILAYIVYVMDTEVEVPLLCYGHFWDVYFHTCLYVIDLFSG